MHLSDLIESLKRFVADDQLLLAINLLKESLPVNSFKYDDVLLLEGRLQHLAGRRLRGVLLEEQAQVTRAGIRESLLLLIDSLTEEELRYKEAEALHRGYGHLLYRIPRKMRLEEQVVCLVRIAKLKKLVEADLTDDDFTEWREVKVSRTMAVELIDPSQTQPFHVNAVQESVQLLEDDDYTEWRFYVTPRRSGKHPLLLKVAVIVAVDGVLRKKEKVLEETVEVMAGEAEAAEEPAFQTMSYFRFSNASFFQASTSFDFYIGSDDRAGEPPVSPRIPIDRVKAPAPAEPAGPPLRTFTDPRDGKRYHTVLINGTRWMAQNLSYDAGPGCRFPAGEANNEAMYGRLYTWEAARAACPPGWQLPTDEQWRELALFFGGYQAVSGKRIIAYLQYLLKRGVAGNPHAYFFEDIAGFYAQYGGRRNAASFRHFQSEGCYWSATGNSERSAVGFQFDRDRKLLLRRPFRKAWALSVRCVMPAS